MTFKVLAGFFIVIAVCLGLGFLSLCCKAVSKFVAGLFEEPDEEDLTDEEKHRLYLEKKHRELAREKINVRALNRDASLDQAEYKNSVKIIGLIEPIGRWTRYVMSEKHQRLVGLKPNKLQNGFWQMLVSMKGMYQGKYKGKSR
ncbi:MAG: hypothetical protein AB8U44_00755 [Aaplasma endosymbiont of Hyalomma asiaticum]